MTSSACVAARRGSILLAGWVVLLAGVMWVLHLLGQGPLASPPLTRLGALAGWVEQRSAPEVAFCGLRLAAMGLSGYLLAATLAGLLARAAGWARCCAALEVVSPAVVRRLLHGAGVTVAATVAVPQAAAWAAPGGQPSQASPVPIMHRLPSGSTSPGGIRQPRSAPTTTALLPSAPPKSAPSPAVISAPSASPPAPTQPSPLTQSPAAVRPAPASSSTWVVRPGDNLWSIAATTLAGAWGRTPSDAEADRYWTAVVAANRSRLANRDDPDLIFPGQVFQLPPTPD